MTKADEVEITATTPQHLEGWRRALDSVARERLYLTFLGSPPLVEAREFAHALLRAGNPHFVAIAEGEVVGWCVSRGFAARPKLTGEGSVWESSPPTVRAASAVA